MKYLVAMKEEVTAPWEEALWYIHAEEYTCQAKPHHLVGVVRQTLVPAIGQRVLSKQEQSVHNGIDEPRIDGQNRRYLPDLPGEWIWSRVLGLGVTAVETHNNC